MPAFRIELDTRRRDWVLKAHPQINHADLRFGNDSTPGFLGLIGAIDMILTKAKRSGGTIEIRHWEEVSVVHFEAQDVPELATMATAAMAGENPLGADETGEKGNGPCPTRKTGR